MSRYAKALTAFFAALGTWGATVFADGNVDPVEWFGLCGVLVATLGVYAVPNRPPSGEPADPAVSEVGPQPCPARSPEGERCVRTAPHVGTWHETFTGRVWPY